MRINLKPCPFCGGSFEIVATNGDIKIILDDDIMADNFSEFDNDEYRFGITHSVRLHPNCPIAMSENQFLGNYEYDWIEEAIELCNRRYIPKTT